MAKLIQMTDADGDVYPTTDVYKVVSFTSDQFTLAAGSSTWIALNVPAPSGYVRAGILQWYITGTGATSFCSPYAVQNGSMAIRNYNGNTSATGTVTGTALLRRNANYTSAD